VAPEGAILMIRITLLGTLLSITSFTAAHPAEWRYCLARVPTSHKVMISRISQTNLTISEAERAFMQLLDHAGIPHEAAICPRAPTPSALMDAREQAIEYNREDHLEPSYVDWSP
jgi:hypothetical protein